MLLRCFAAVLGACVLVDTDRVLCWCCYMCQLVYYVYNMIPFLEVVAKPISAALCDAGRF